jgi:hypothetical protein
MYEPQSVRLVRVRSRISTTRWEARVDRAKEIEKYIQQVESFMRGGDSQNAAIGKIFKQNCKCVWLLRHLIKYKKNGFEGLIDCRMPRDPQLSDRTREIIQTACLGNPNAGPDAIVNILNEQRISQIPSEPTIKKEIRRIKNRQKYAEKKQKQETPEIVKLPLAGGELLLAAELETGIMQAVTDEVMNIAKEANEAAGDRVAEKDTNRRDRLGHFTKEYNKSRQREPGQKIPDYLRSAEHKAKGRVPNWARFAHENKSSIGAKINTLTLSWGVLETKGWDALRSPRVTGLGELTGYAYMPSTLSKMTSALAISGAGNRLLDAVGVGWHKVASQRWGERGSIAALYVDNHSKEVWSSLYTLSGKVSHLNRVMPCISTTYIHTGAGASLVASVQSGGAPLAPRLLDIINATEKKLGEEKEIRRAVVIDSEGSTFDILESFAKNTHNETKSRIIVTPLRPSRMPSLEIRHAEGAEYQPYREHDKLRIGKATLNHKTTGRSIEIGTLEVQREHRENDTILLTNGLELEESGKNLADLYFRRWPIQENFFKAAGPIGLKEHRGNCGEMVANVAIESKLEKLERQERKCEKKIIELNKELPVREAKAKEIKIEKEEVSRELVQYRKTLDTLITNGMRDGKEIGNAAARHQLTLAHYEAVDIKDRKAEKVYTELRAQQEKSNASLTEIKEKKEKLTPLKTIRKIDVELDKILTATKLTFSLLITFVLREYLLCASISPQTFLSRVLCLDGRRETTTKEETIVFYENPRDPELAQALQIACSKLNERHLQRNNRLLRYQIEPAPS